MSNELTLNVIESFGLHTRSKLKLAIAADALEEIGGDLATAEAWRRGYSFLTSFSYISRSGGYSAVNYVFGCRHSMVFPFITNIVHSGAGISVFYEDNPVYSGGLGSGGNSDMFFVESRGDHVVVGFGSGNGKNGLGFSQHYNRHDHRGTGSGGTNYSVGFIYFNRRSPPPELEGKDFHG